MKEFSLDEYRAILRQDLCTFTHRAFRELNPNTPFLQNWHNELIASKLQACLDHTINRLIINVPPRSLKSLSAAVAFPAFVLGHRPSTQIISASYGQDLANKHSLDCRNLMGSAWYQEMFPGTRLSVQKQSLQEFVTTQNGFRMATSVGGVLTGRGADIIIIDDPSKPDEALSDALRHGVNGWYDHTLYSRLNDKRMGCIIIIMQRLHMDDLVGHVMEQEGWELVRLPAIAEEDEVHLITSPLGNRTVYRRAGEALHPDREPLAVLEHLRQTIGTYNFASQYQQRPVPLAGGLVKREWFRSYLPNQRPTKFDSVLQSWDTANKSSELNDFSVCTTWGVRDQRFYLLGVFRKRLDYPDLKKAVKRLAQEFQATIVLIEDRASGTSLIQDLRRDGVCGVTSYDPKGLDKIARMSVVTARIESGSVYLPDKAEWLEAYLSELCTFPNSKYDDQADSTSQALEWAARRVLSYTLSTYLAQQATKYGRRLDPKLLDPEDSDPPALPRCPNCLKYGPAQYGRTFRCGDCGFEWSADAPPPEIPTCLGDDGETLEWNSWRKLWFDPKTGTTYEPSDPDDPEKKG